MMEDQRQELPLLREFEWEARHNYINSMMNHFFDLFPAGGRCESSLNDRESKNRLADIMINHLRCSQDAVDSLGVRQYEELGDRRTDSLDEFGNQLELELRKLLKKRAPFLADLLHNADEDYLLDISMVISEKTGEKAPLDSKLPTTVNAANAANNHNVFSNSKVKSSVQRNCFAVNPYVFDY